MPASENPSTTKCAHCEGVRFRWRVKRVRGSGTASLRTLVWTCQGCGGDFEEPLSSDRHANGTHPAP